MIASNSASMIELEKWYMQRMEADGWKGEVALRSERGLFGGPFVSLKFLRNNELISIMLTFLPKEDYTMLQLTRGTQGNELSPR